MMKKVILFILLFAVSIGTFPQKNNPPPLLTKQDYLEKSKNQKTTAWILRGSGAVLFITGIIWAATNFDSAGPDVLLVAGGVCILSSVPLFMASKKNKRRAINMTTNIKMEKATIIERQSFVQSSYPAIALKINL